MGTKDIVLLSLQIIGSLTAIFGVYKIYFESKFLYIDKLINYGSFFKTNDQAFFDEFFFEQVKRRVYESMTGIKYSMKDDADWLYKYFDCKQELTYLAKALPYLIIDREKQSIAVRTGIMNTLFALGAFISSLTCLLLSIIYSPIFYDSISFLEYMRFVLFVCLSLIFSIGTSPFIIPRIVYHRFKLVKNKKSITNE